MEIEKHEGENQPVQVASELNTQLGIYYAYWDQGGFGLSAVVVAGSETEAVRLLDLDEAYETLERIVEIGKALPLEKACVVCRESL